MKIVARLEGLAIVLFVIVFGPAAYAVAKLIDRFDTFRAGEGR
mgnify:CR=1